MQGTFQIAPMGMGNLSFVEVVEVLVVVFLNFTIYAFVPVLVSVVGYILLKKKSKEDVSKKIVAAVALLAMFATGLFLYIYYSSKDSTIYF